MLYEKDSNWRTFVPLSSSYMPKKMDTVELVVGYVQSSRDRLKQIVYRLENQIEYSRQELAHVRTDLIEMEAGVQVQAVQVKDSRMPLIMQEFRELMDRAVEQRARREKALDNPKRHHLQFGTVDPDMVNETSQNVEMPPDAEKTPVPERPTAPQSLPITQPPPVETDTWTDYASDNEERFPAEMRSIVRPGPRFEPVRTESSETVRTQPYDPNEPPPGTSRREDLRGHIERQRLAANYGVHQRYPSAHQERDRSNLRGRNRQLPNLGSREPHVEREFVRSRNNSNERSGPPPSLSEYPSSSVGSLRREFPEYVPRPMEKLSGPVSGRPYPPFLYEPPIPLVRKDPNLVGMSEIFVHPLRTRAKICPICPMGQHRLYSCATFLRMGLQEKWYTALKKGVCLNCLIRGHSHLSCKEPGTCSRCGIRHNSKLCPTGPSNL